METLSFQVSQQIREIDDMSVNIDTIKCFPIREKYSFKKSNNQHESPKSPESTRNEFMESITTNKNHPATKEPTHDATDEDNLMKLFDQSLWFDVDQTGFTRT